MAARSYAASRAAADFLVRPGADHGRPGLRRRQGRAAALRPRRVRDARPGADLGRRRSRGRTTPRAPAAAPRPCRTRGRARRRSRTCARCRIRTTPTRRTTTGARTTSPRRAWRRRWAWEAPIESAQVQRDGSLRAESVRLPSGVGCAPSRRSASQIARSLHLLSTWFSVGQLSALGEQRHVLYGSRVTVSARAANVKDAVLQQRSSDGAWHAVRSVRQPARLSFQPRASTAYRLVAPGTNGTSVSVAVAPRVQVACAEPARARRRGLAAAGRGRRGLARRARPVARRRASDPRRQRELQDGVAAPPGRVPDHGRRRQDGRRSGRRST